MSTLQGFQMIEIKNIEESVEKANESTPTNEEYIDKHESELSLQHKLSLFIQIY